MPTTPPPIPGDSSFTLNTPPTPRYAPIDEPDRTIHRKRAKDTAPSINSQHGSIKKPSKQQQQPAISQIAPLTPAETPINRKKQVDAISGSSNHTGRVLFPTHTPKKKVVGSGRAYVKTPNNNATAIIKPQDEENETTAKNNNAAFKNVNIVSLDEMKQKSFDIFDDTKAMKREIDNNDPFNSEPMPKRRAIESSINHPHKPLSKDAAGMWYVFRGKKVFRPFPKGDKEMSSLKPRRLFDTPKKRSTRSTNPEKDPFNSSEDEKKSQEHKEGDTDVDNSEEDDTDREDEDFKRKSSSENFFTNKPYPKKTKNRI